MPTTSPHLRTFGLSLKRVVSLCTCMKGFVFALVLSAAVTIGYGQANFTIDMAQTGVQPTFFDYFVFSLQSDSKIPVAWLLSPIISMLFASVLWQRDSEPAYVVAHTGWRSIWIEHFADLLVVSMLVSVTIFTLCAAASLLNSTDFSPLGSPGSAMPLFTTGSKLETPPSALTVLVVCFIHLLSTVTFSMTCFTALRWQVRGNTAPFIVITVLALPDVHGRNSFVYDLTRNFLGEALTTNPLYVFYGFQGIEWASWLPGASHNLWFLPLLTLAVFLLVLFSTRRIDLIPRSDKASIKQWGHNSRTSR